MRLIEIVRGAETSDETAQTAMKLAPKIGKVGVMCGVCDGFVGNRMLYQYSRQANFLIEEGALPQDVDRVMFEFGLPMGPFAMSDLAGVDVGYLVRQERLKKYGRTNKRESTVGDAIYHLGRYGQKTGKGWYDYAPGSRTPQPNAGVTALIEKASADLGIERRDIGDDEILERCMYPLVNEGARLLAEGHRGPAARYRPDLDLRLRLPALSRRSDALGRRDRPGAYPGTAGAPCRDPRSRLAGAGAALARGGRAGDHLQGMGRGALSAVGRHSTGSRYR